MNNRPSSLGTGLRTSGTRKLLLWLAIAGSPLPTWAAPSPISAEAFASQTAAAQGTAAACAGAAPACDPGALPADALVTRPDGTTFRGSWTWLREALASARDKPGPERAAAMRDATAHLDEIAAQTRGTQTRETQTRGTAAAFDQAGLSQAQRAAAPDLARAEFAPDAGPSWFDRQVAKIEDWFLRLLLGMDRLGTHNPWLAPLVEWICFLLAAGGLVFFIRRSLARANLRISLGEGTAPSWSGREATDWARLAEQHAAAAAWRDAVHCLYWAAIISLEDRRAWRPDPTRTPREYLRLLPPASAAQTALREITRTLERIWYGQAEATAEDFRAAAAALATIATTDLKRERTTRPPASALTSAPGVS